MSFGILQILVNEDKLLRKLLPAHLYGTLSFAPLKDAKTIEFLTNVLLNEEYADPRDFSLSILKGLPLEDLEVIDMNELYKQCMTKVPRCLDINFR